MIKKHKTFRKRIFTIVNDPNDFDPYNTTDKIVNLVRKIIKERIKAIELARKEEKKEKMKKQHDFTEI